MNGCSCYDAPGECSYCTNRDYAIERRVEELSVERLGCEPNDLPESVLLALTNEATAFVDGVPYKSKTEPVQLQRAA